MEDAEEGEGGLVMRGRTAHEQKKIKINREKGKEKKIMIYLQLPCEILMGSLSSGKPAPAICSSVK